MITLSLAMIVKNEEAVLERCLDSIKEVVDEIIIVDTGSTDKTVEIAEKYTDKIYHFEWIHDFAAARNHAFSKATCEYIMWLDADDYVEEDELKKLAALKENFDRTLDAVYLRYHVGFDGAGNPTMTNYRERILRRAMNFKWAEPVHECIAVTGKSIKVDIAICHGHKERTFSSRNLDIYEKQDKLSARGMFYYGRELKEHGRFADSIVQHEQFLKDGLGWREDNIRACNDLNDCYIALKQPEIGVERLFKSFLYDKPRSEVCCKIGAYFFDKKDWHNATYWYDLATHPNSHTEAGFFNPDYCNYIPSIQLCVIFSKIGLHKKAYEYHLKTKVLKPENPSVLFNEDYFNKFFKENPEALEE